MKGGGKGEEILIDKRRETQRMHHGRSLGGGRLLKLTQH